MHFANGRSSVVILGDRLRARRPVAVGCRGGECTGLVRFSAREGSDDMLRLTAIQGKLLAAERRTYVPAKYSACRCRWRPSQREDREV